MHVYFRLLNMIFKTYTSNKDLTGTSSCISINKLAAMDVRHDLPSLLNWDPTSVRGCRAALLQYLFWRVGDGRSGRLLM